MRDLFPGWVPPDEATLDRYWNEATFAVDASVLLDLYRFSEQARTGLLNALRSMEDRLWIPHQVALEFHRNRFSVLLAQREAEGTLLSGLDRIKEELLKQLGERLKGAGRRDLAPLEEAIDSGFERLRENLKEAEKEHTKGLGQSISEDPIYEEVVDLCGGRVGEPFSEEQQAAVLAEAEERFRSKRPPGYLDADKEDERRFGDVILWYQLCDKAKETKMPVVLISDDRKADWVWEERGKTLGPRPELVAEMQQRAGVGFHMYTPTRFLQVWERREEGREVEPEVLAELEGSGASSSSGPPSIGDFLRKYFENRLLLQGAPTWASHGGNVVRAQASHQVELDSVELMLEVRIAFGHGSPLGALVTVRRSESELKMQAFPLTNATSDPAEQRLNYSVNYPSQFGGVGLLPGDYEVIWELAEKPESPLGSFREVARDHFTVQPPSES